MRTGKGRRVGADHQNYKHGMFGTRIYRIWAGMKRRCYNKNDHAYPRYGGRGITVCDKWLDFAGFYEDMGPSYEPDLTIERLDNNKGYDPSNCVWIPKEDQSRNRRIVHRVEYRGKSYTVRQLSELVGINKAILYQRIFRWGWPLENAVSIQPRYGHKHINYKSK